MTPMRHTLHSSLLVLSVAVALPLLAAPSTAQRGPSSTIVFEENRGQTSAAVRYLARAPRHTLYATAQDVSFELWGKSEMSSVVRLTFPGSRAAKHWVAGGDPVGDISYFVGNDPSRWVRSAKQYASLTWKDVYPGVDAVFYSNGREIEYDLVLASGADPSAIRLRFDAAAALDSSGQITIDTPAGRLVQKRPHIYQNTPDGKVEIDGRFVAAATPNEFALALGAYDASQPLLVDPVLSYSTYLGGENDDEIVAVNVAFIAGNTQSILFPGAPLARRRSRDIFLRMTTSTGYPQGATTIYGGTGDDELTSAVYSTTRYTFALGGATSSRDFYSNSYTPPPAFKGGATDGFVLVWGQNMSPQLSLIGGSGADRVNALSVSNYYVGAAGVTDSRDFETLPAMPPAPGGGTDAFVWAARFISSYFEPYGATLLGGSADDTALAVSFDSSSRILVGGETRSPDFPLIGDNPGERRGDSDAFLAKFSFSYPQIASMSSRLIGGSGEDRIEAIRQPVTTQYNGVVLQSQPLIIAGTTSSPDFPLVSPTQDHFGGETDAFVARYDETTGTLAFSTYLGGGGADRATAVAQDSSNSILVAGVTRSTDLAVYEAVQPSPGGGEDGFFAFIDSLNRIQQLTYFGGSGDDRVNDVVSVTGGARIVGSTTSADLPLVNPAQHEKDGGWDGFVADIGTAYLSGPERINVGKDLVSSFALSSALGSHAGLVTITLRSSDPSRVRFLHGSVSKDELVISSTTGSWSVTVEGLADSGEVTLTATAPGHAPKTIAVRSFPVVVTSNYYASGSAASPVYNILTWSSGTGFSAGYALFDPETNQAISSAARRPGAPPVTLDWALSGDGVATLVRGTQPYELNTAYVRPVAVGTATLTLICDTLPVWPPVPITINVVRPSLRVSELWLGKDLQLQAPFAYGQKSGDYFSSITLGSTYVAKGEITFRSSDPSRLLLSASASEAGQAEITIPIMAPSGYAASVVFAQALASSGDVSILISSPEIDGDYALPVKLAAPYAAFTYYTADTVNEVTMTTGNKTSFSPMVDIEGRPASGYFTYSLRPGAAPVQVKYHSSDESVVMVPEESFELPLTTSAPVVTAVTPGRADLTLTTDRADFPGRGHLAITVVPPDMPKLSSLSALLLGKQVQSDVWYSLPSSVKSAVTVSVDDTSMAVLATDSQPNGTGRMTLEPNSNGAINFRVYGLKSAGETTYRIDVPGFGKVDAKILLHPVGFGFTSESVTRTYYSTATPAVGVYAYLLDDATGIPVGTAALRKGSQITLRLRTEGDSVTLDNPTVTIGGPVSGYSYSYIQASYQVRSVGLTTIFIDAPEGFETPSRRVRQKLNIVRSVVSFTGSPIAGKDAVGQASWQTESISAKPTATITSADPSRLLLAARIGDPGSASIVTANSTIYLYAFDDSGSVQLTATTDGAEPATVDVALRPLVIALSSDLSAGVTLKSKARKESWSVQLKVAGETSSSSVQLRPGLAPVRIEIVSDDSSVASVEPRFVETTGVQSPVVSVTALDPGETTIRLAAVGGIPANVVNIPVRVVRQGFVIESVGVGKDLQTRVYLQAETSLDDNHIVTVTSTAPDRLLLSRDSKLPGSPTLQVPLQTSGYSTSPAEIFLQALAGDGEVQLRISAPGFNDSVATVTLVPTVIRWSSTYGVTMPLNGAGEYQAISVSKAAVKPDLGYSYEYGWRPGAPRVWVSIGASAEGVVSVEPDSIALGPDVNSPQIKIVPRSIGKTKLSLNIPPGFADPGASYREIPVQVTPSPLSLNCGYGSTVGRDAIVTCSVGVRPGVKLTATSLDPSRLTVSFGQTAVGVPSSTSVTTGQYSQAIYLHGLADSGEAKVTLSAPDHTPYTATVKLVPTTYTIETWWNAAYPIQVQAGQYRNVSVKFVYSDGYYTRDATMRPGAPDVTIGLASSNSVVAVPNPSSLVFRWGDSVKPFRVEGKKVGNATFTMTLPEGFPEPAAKAFLVEVR